MLNPAAFAAAYVLDLLFKDPHFALHPVRLIGRFIGAQEAYYRRKIPGELTGGFLLSLVTVLTVFGVSFLMVAVCGAIHPAAGAACHALLIYFSMSPAALAAEGGAVARLLESGDVEAARSRLSMIVGRDTQTMDRPAIVRAAVETMAENSVDAVISPLFYALIGGGPLAMAYRAVNTCDSMVGYRDERYEYFGKTSARLDDAANFIPARLSLHIIPVSARLARLDARAAREIGRRDRLNHASPNSAHGEAAFAGALGIRLGGLSYYGGAPEMKSWIGDGKREPTTDDLRSAVRLLRVVSAVSVLLCAAIAWGVPRLAPLF